MLIARDTVDGTHRGDGFVTTRARAYAEGLMLLAGRVSVAERLTERQRERISRDDPFEVSDPAHRAMRGDS